MLQRYKNIPVILSQVLTAKIVASPYMHLRLKKKKNIRFIRWQI